VSTAHALLAQGDGKRRLLDCVAVLQVVEQGLRAYPLDTVIANLGAHAFHAQAPWIGVLRAAISAGDAHNLLRNDMFVHLPLTRHLTLRIDLP
jgi:hypothetical protein